MTTTEIEKRLLSVERELAELKSRVMIPASSPNHWLEKIAGTFSSAQDKAAFEQAMRYGREWRTAQRTRPRKRKASGK
jgi:hypothetical protein